MTTRYPKTVIYGILCLVFTPMILSAQFALKQNDLPQSVSLHNFASIADVGKNELSFEQVLSDEERLNFKPLLTENSDLGFTDHNFWVKFEIQNTTNTTQQYFLETARPITDLVELYSVSDDGLIHRAKSGDKMPVNERDFNHRKTLFKLAFDPNSTQRIYLHLKSDGEVINLPLKLETSDALLNTTAAEYLVFGIFYGILVLTAIIYLFFYFAIRQKAFLYYSLYVLFIGLMQFSLDGYFYQYLAPSGGWMSQHAVLFFATISAFFLGKYAQVFLGINKSNWIQSRIYTALFMLVGVLFAALIFAPSFLKLAYPLVNILGLFILILIVVSIIVKYFKREKVDGFFTTGIFFLVSGFVVFILNNFSQIPNSFFTQNSSKLGTGMEVIFLSLSMANLIKKIRDDKEKLDVLALKRSEEMSELKSYFLSNISHELRTPLNAIINITDVIGEETESKKIMKNCQIIKYSSYSLLSSVNDILDYSKISKNEFMLDMGHFQPINILEHIKNMASLKAKQQGLKFKYSVADDVPDVVNGDVNRFAQILNNVLSNAIKFTPQGFVKFTVSCENKMDGKARLVFVIEDSGIGISKEKLNSIYDSFTHESINTMRKYGGLGLGLFITKAVVDKQNGTIDFQTKEGQGTICTIALDYEIILAEPKVLMETTPIFDLNGKNILVVEDNAINQMVIKKITQKWLNTNVVFANNGQEGLDSFKNHHFDLVLMDLQMPVMDGYEATIAIRKGEAGEKNSRIPIIAVTADVMETTKQKVIEIGMNHYLSKPIKGDTLFEAIQKLVS